MTASDLLQHAALYEWFIGTFPTRYTMAMKLSGNNSDGYQNPRTRHIAGGKIGLHFSEAEGTHLFYQSHFSDNGWSQAFPSTRLVRDLAVPHDKQLVALAARRQPHSLARRLAYWGHLHPFLVERTGIANDLRQMAYLALVINYQIPTS